ncbi:hypothetical protein PSTG_05625 [Puccinia striiformis f. sp. tritici PST-78]|uniref:Uncharacterized protein n=1 Tax=Puccinia striiformis f. sp. tritici PST-78 TaxID=1165861 RepID=A0A0L0VPQ0_9BASI|nr:hypothetical protein PSTG_05625 [Puccinia striiformis f. sp. tritici PST-78]
MTQPPNRKKKQTKSNNQTSPSKQKYKRKKKNTAATAVDESGEVEVVLDITQDLDAANLKVRQPSDKEISPFDDVQNYFFIPCHTQETNTSIQDLDASVHQLENLVKTTAKPSSLSSTSLPSAPLQPGIDTALTQTIVKNTVKDKLGNLPAGPLRESCNQEELEQKLEAHSKDQRRDFVKLNDRLDRAMSQFRSSEAGVREELSGLSALILQEPNNPTRKTPPHLPPLPHVPPPRGDNSDSEDDQEPIDKEVQHQLPSAIAKSDWPKFSGRDEYDLVQLRAGTKQQPLPRRPRNGYFGKQRCGTSGERRLGNKKLKTLLMQTSFYQAIITQPNGSLGSITDFSVLLLT